MVDELISFTPDRAELYAMAGEALLEMGEIGKSIAAYGQAIKHRPNYYLYHLHRGELMMDGDVLQAEQHLLQSIARLPTVQGYLLLGQLMERTDRMDRAYDYFVKAGESDSDPGKQAAKQAKRIDFDKHPDRYIHIKHIRQGQDKVMLLITNINPYQVDLKSLLLTAGQDYRIKLSRTIAPAQSITSTVTIRELGEIEGVRVDQAELIQ